MSNLDFKAIEAQAVREIPIVPLDREGQQRLISKRGAICTCAAAIACMGSGLGFGTLIPADQTPQINQLQKNITELTKLALEGDEDSSLLTSLEQVKEKLEKDNGTRKAIIEDQNRNILELQEKNSLLGKEKETLTLQIDNQLEEIKKLKKENGNTKLDLEIANYQRTVNTIELTEENKLLHSQLRKITGDGLRELLVKFCESSKGTALGRIYGNKKFTKIDCVNFTKEISQKLT